MEVTMATGQMLLSDGNRYCQPTDSWSWLERHTAAAFLASGRCRLITTTIIKSMRMSAWSQNVSVAAVVRLGCLTTGRALYTLVSSLCCWSVLLLLHFCWIPCFVPKLFRHFSVNPILGEFMLSPPRYVLC